MSKTNKKGRLALLAVLLVWVGLAGCVGPTEHTEGPQAELAVGEDAAFAGEPVRFHAAGAYDHGSVVAYHLDFGDGNTTTVPANDTDEPATVEHTYDRPGVYTATLTVEAQNGNDTVNATASQTVRVHERIEEDFGVLVAAPGDAAGPSRGETTFTAGDNATTYDLSVSLEAVGPVEATARIVLRDADGALLVEHEAEVGGETVRLDFAGDLAPGTYTLEVIALSGAVHAVAALVVTYGTE